MSLQAQKRAIKKLCKAKGLKLLQIYEDVCSGSDIVRPGLDQLKDKMLDGTVKYIIVTALDRLSRSLLLSLLLNDYFESLKVLIYLVPYGIIDTKSTEGYSFYIINSFLSEIERRRTSDRTSEALNMLKDSGKVYGRIPYGKKQKGDKLIDDMPEQTTISIIQRMDIEGCSLARIIYLLPTHNIYSRSGKAFQRIQIKRILDQNPLPSVLIV